jgi:iron complex transport system substrate-binding protein
VALAAAQDLSNSATCAQRVRFCNVSGGVDYFPSKVSFDYATTIERIVYNRTFVALDFRWDDFAGLNRTAYYVFVRCGCPSPGLDPRYKEIYVPVSSAFVQQTPTVPKFYLLGQRAKVTAVESDDFLTTAEILDDVRDGFVLDIDLNYTRLLDAAVNPRGLPDVLVTGSGNITRASWVANVTTFEARRFIDNDAGETSPLGRAELMKLYGILCGVEDTAVAIFSTIEDDYEEAKRVALQAKRRPSVMLGLPFSGSWSVTRGSSYVGQFLRDANVEYKNALNAVPSPLNATSYLATFSQAQFWINANCFTGTGIPCTLDQVAAGNATRTPQGDRPIFTQFLAFQCDNVFGNDGQLTPISVGNPFFEEGVVRPDLILKDLVQIMHPDLDFEHTRYFYRQMSNLTDRTGVPECPFVDFPSIPQGGVYVTRLYRVSGLTGSALLDAVHPTLKPLVSTRLGVPASMFEIYLTAQQPRNDSVQFAINWLVPCPQPRPECGIDAARKLETITEQIVLGWIGALAPTPVSVSSVQSTRVRSPDGLDVALAELDKQDEDSDGLSTRVILAIVFGCLAAIVFVGVVIGCCAFRAGSSAAYKKMQISSGASNAQELTRGV